MLQLLRHLAVLAAAAAAGSSWPSPAPQGASSLIDLLITGGAPPPVVFSDVYTGLDVSRALPWGGDGYVFVLDKGRGVIGLVKGTVNETRVPGAVASGRRNVKAFKAYSFALVATLTTRAGTRAATVSIEDMVALGSDSLLVRQALAHPDRTSMRVIDAAAVVAQAAAAHPAALPLEITTGSVTRARMSNDLDGTCTDAVAGPAAAADSAAAAGRAFPVFVCCASGVVRLDYARAGADGTLVASTAPPVTTTPCRMLREDVQPEDGSSGDRTLVAKGDSGVIEVLTVSGSSSAAAAVRATYHVPAGDIVDDLRAVGGRIFVAVVWDGGDGSVEEWVDDPQDERGYAVALQAVSGRSGVAALGEGLTAGSPPPPSRPLLMVYHASSRGTVRTCDASEPDVPLLGGAMAVGSGAGGAPAAGAPYGLELSGRESALVTVPLGAGGMGFAYALSRAAADRMAGEVPAPTTDAPPTPAPASSAPSAPQKGGAPFAPVAAATGAPGGVPAKRPTPSSAPSSTASPSPPSPSPSPPSPSPPSPSPSPPAVLPLPTPPTPPTMPTTPPPTPTPPAVVPLPPSSTAHPLRETPLPSPSPSPPSPTPQRTSSDAPGGGLGATAPPSSAPGDAGPELFQHSFSADAEAAVSTFGTASALVEMGLGGGGVGAAMRLLAVSRVCSVLSTQGGEDDKEDPTLRMPQVTNPFCPPVMGSRLAGFVVGNTVFVVASLLLGWGVGRAVGWAVPVVRPAWAGTAAGVDWYGVTRFPAAQTAVFALFLQGTSIATFVLVFQSFSSEGGGGSHGAHTALILTGVASLAFLAAFCFVLRRMIRSALRHSDILYLSSDPGDLLRPGEDGGDAASAAGDEADTTDAGSDADSRRSSPGSLSPAALMARKYERQPQRRRRRRRRRWRKGPRPASTMPSKPTTSMPEDNASDPAVACAAAAASDTSDAESTSDEDPNVRFLYRCNRPGSNHGSGSRLGSARAAAPSNGALLGGLCTNSNPVHHQLCTNTNTNSSNNNNNPLLQNNTSGGGTVRAPTGAPSHGSDSSSSTSSRGGTDGALRRAVSTLFPAATVTPHPRFAQRARAACAAAFLADGEWYSRRRELHVVNRCSIVVRNIRPRAVDRYFLCEMLASVALAAVVAAPAPHRAACGGKSLLATLIFLACLLYELGVRPHSRAADTVLYVIFHLLQTVSLALSSVGHYRDPSSAATRELFSVSSALLTVALVVLVVHTAVKLFTNVYVVCRGFRREAQERVFERTEWLRTAGGADDATAVVADAAGGGEGGGSGGQHRFVMQPVGGRMAAAASSATGTSGACTSRLHTSPSPLHEQLWPHPEAESPSSQLSPLPATPLPLPLLPTMQLRPPTTDGGGDYMRARRAASLLLSPRPAALSSCSPASSDATAGGGGATPAASSAATTPTVEPADDPRARRCRSALSLPPLEATLRQQPQQGRGGGGGPPTHQRRRSCVALRSPAPSSRTASPLRTGSRTGSPPMSIASNNSAASAACGGRGGDAVAAESLLHPIERYQSQSSCASDLLVERTVLMMPLL